jgi:hypothetical protein
MIALEDGSITVQGTLSGTGKEEYKLCLPIAISPAKRLAKHAPEHWKASVDR